MAEPRRIDHLVVAVRDLEGAGDFYRRLGFQVGARNRHPWGTENRLVQFDGNFVELITVADGAQIEPHVERSFSFGAFVRDYLARREGLAMLVLESRDAAADARGFAGAGIGDFEPFFFAREARRPDGTPTKVAFTLAFARDEEAPGAAFFVCQQHYPENFWNEAHQRHPNGAKALTSVVLAAEAPERHRSFAQAFTGASARTVGQGLSLALAHGGRLDIVQPEEAARLFGSVEIEGHPVFVAFGVAVPDIARQIALLEQQGVAYERIGSRAVVPASAASGVAIAFEAV